MINVTLTGGDFGGEIVEVEAEGQRVVRESATHSFTYEVRRDPETDELVGVCIGVARISASLARNK